MNKKKIVSAVASGLSASAIAVSSAISAFAEETQPATAVASSSQEMTPSSAFLSMGLPMLILFALLYFVAIRPQKKRDQEMKDMQANIQVGDEIVTGGGIVGIVVSIGDDTVVIETGGAKHKLRIKNWAITENVTAAERMKAEKPAKKSPLASAGVVDDTAKEKKSKKASKDE
ncbi:MAG: preprotein translocase subunit YajC [Firmicutes bacterium ADurb.BinA205]|nr:MAG: preprotein translocase subunit YajC [Firmicutes bacterium ADurb.BinA205]